MAKIIQINAQLATQDGGVVAPGAVVLFSVGFPAGKISYTANLLPYRSLSALLSGVSPLNNIVNWVSSFVYNPSEADFDSITPLVIYENIRASLGAIYGDANVVLIDLPTPTTTTTSTSTTVAPTTSTTSTTTSHA